MRDAFDLDPSLTHLNHGSFGAVPRVVTEHQRRVRARAEANPMRFFRVEGPALKAEARQVAGDFLGVGADEVALLRNPTRPPRSCCRRCTSRAGSAPATWSCSTSRATSP